MEDFPENAAGFVGNKVGDFERPFENIDNAYDDARYILVPQISIYLSSRSQLDANLYRDNARDDDGGGRSTLLQMKFDV